MRRRTYKPVWLLLALLFAGQSLLPVAALAQVSMRCVGAPASSAPCAQATVVATDSAAITKPFSRLACCRTMPNCPGMAAPASVSQAVSRPVRGFSLVASNCLVSVSLFNTKPATLGPQAQRWLLLSAPVLAPPAVHAVSVVLDAPPAVVFPEASFRLPPSISTHAHGLRAPPAN